MTSNETAIYPTEENHFKAHRTPMIGVTALIIGGLILLWAIWMILSQGIFNSGAIIGLIVTAGSYLWLTRPYFVIAPNRLTIYNLIGSTVKRYPFKEFSDLTVRDNHLYIEDAAESTSRKVNINKQLTKSSDWQTLEALTKAIP